MIPTLIAGHAIAAPTTYTGSQEIDGETARIVVTTDGTMGKVQSKNILDFNITLSGPKGDATLTPRNASAVTTNSSNLIASPTQLSYDFIAPGLSYVMFGNADNTVYLCIQNAGCSDGGVPGMAATVRGSAHGAFVSESRELVLARRVEGSGAKPAP